MTDGRRTDAGGASAPRPNFVYIMADDHAAHGIGAYGSRVNATPEILIVFVLMQRWIMEGIATTGLKG